MFNKLKLSAKITALAVVLLTIMAVLGATAVVNMLNSNTRVQRIAYEFTTASDHATEISGITGQMRVRANLFSATDNESYYAGFLEYLAELRKEYDRAEAFLKNAPSIVGLRNNLPVMSVKAKIAGELKDRHDNGSFLCYFEEENLILYTFPN